jgi:hypothetical protein
MEEQRALQRALQVLVRCQRAQKKAPGGVPSAKTLLAKYLRQKHSAWPIEAESRLLRKKNGD